MQYFVAVRALCEFTAKQGDLDLRFTPSPSAQEGIAGHQLVSARRGPGYETEITLRGEFERVVVRGRADGYDAALNRLEEIKTHRGDLARQPANYRKLHWAQAKIYGWLMCQARGLADVNLALVYFDIATQEETVVTEAHSADALRLFFELHCGHFLAWADRELEHRKSRDEALGVLAFPHTSFRIGQRELAEAVYKTAAHGRCLLAQAPTGIGKTIATIFPVLKAVPAQGLDKIFFLAAKTTGRRLALDATDLIRGSAPGLKLRVLELTAREKACEHPDKSCHGESCPLAKGFYDRLPAARLESLESGSMDGESLRGIALRHAVCPYYLGQELARWADLIVGDYNYYFDGSAMLHAMTLANDWRVGVLADEAHNLVERARAMYTGAMSKSALKSARSHAPAALKKPLDKLNRCWNTLCRHQEGHYAILAAPPVAFMGALKQASAAIADHFAQTAPQPPSGSLQQFHFDMLRFIRLEESFGSHSACDMTVTPAPPGKQPDAVIHIRNLIPAHFLKPRFGAAWSAALFSATLTPRRFYQDMLGLPDNTACIDVASPFSADQLTVALVKRISTRFADRQRSSRPIALLIAEQYERQPGNYLAFFSSFDYLDLVASDFRERSAAVPTWAQSRGMGQAQRKGFLERFVPGGTGVGFAVLGGSFAEGIDLRGDRLVGAFIATLGLPQINPVNEQLRQRMEEAYGCGYDYTYLFPGIQKVVQAAGRVIRTPEDKGIVYLIDDRFARPAVRALLPAWWHVGP